MDVSFKISGGDTLLKYLGDLPKKVERKIVAKALREGAKAVHKAQQATARSMVGGDMGNLIARSLKVRAMKRSRTGPRVRVMIDPKVTEQLTHHAKQGRKQWYIPMVVEYGYTRGNTTVQPIPWARTGFENAVTQAQAKIENQIREGLNRERAANTP